MYPGGTWGQFVRRHAEYTVITSPELVAELAAVLTKPALQVRLFRFAHAPEYGEVLRAFERAEVIIAPPSVSVCRDADDDKFFACAVAGGADYIVSEDEDILAIPEYEGVKTIRTAAFLKLLDTPAP